jgi:molybdenum cofactor guanylyltransferase
MGFVLAGGRSSRMGRNKALLPFRGGVLIESVAGIVRQAAGEAILVGDPNLYAALGFTVVPDLYPGEGPLGGILTALRHSGASWNLMVACDMPDLTVDFLNDLFARAEGSGADALLPAGPSGRLEPLCAVYHSRSRPALLDVAEAARFHNVNTPEDWADHARR